MRYLLLSGLFIFIGNVNAQQVNTNQQALEQLRILQNRFENNPSGKTAATPMSNTSNPTSTATPSVPVAAPPPPIAPNINSPNVVTREDDSMIENLAYEQAEKQIFPMKEKEIVKMHDKYKKIELAKTTDPTSPPKPVATSQFVNLSPGSTPPVIRLAQGFVSSLVFLDSTGAPWPISAYDLGD
ncbi:MAG: intracellular multiplication protein IcmK, partial [Pseudomonadota bacterium]|nr:intracellular multiplication protein IcmK [Pseudomonadota bacterium]